jgi:tRNA 2-thiocytidine biosynthesis protein TtcA
MFRALMNARPSHLLDPDLFDFAGLTRKMQIGDNSSDIPKLR